MDRSSGKIRADVVHRKLTAMGYGGSERTTRRAVAGAKASWRAGHRRTYRPWIPEPGMWLQWDWGEGPRIGGRRTRLFCCWLAWSRFRVVLPSWDQDLGSLTACLDRALRIAGGAGVSADRQRQDGDDRACGRDTGAASGHGGAGPALRLQGGDVPAVRP